MEASPNTRASKNVLVVDADAEFAGMVAQAIHDASGMYDVSVVTHAQDAIAHVQTAIDGQRPFDLLIVDIGVPDSSGMRLLEDLARIAPQIKTITMTAYHSPDLAARVQHLHVHTYLIKPIAPSRFRRLVMEALEDREPSPEWIAPPPPLSSAQQNAIEQLLSNLRRNSGSEAALLIHASGAMRAIDCLETDLDASALCQTLLDAQRIIAQTLAQTLHTDASIQQSYYGTATYSICIYRLNSAHVIATIFGPAIREGHVWYYMREAAEELEEALTAEPEDAPTRRSRVLGDGAGMVEQYFANLSAGRAHNREARASDTRAGRGRRAGRARAGRDTPSSISRLAEPPQIKDPPSTPDPAPGLSAATEPASPPEPAAPPMPEPDPLPLDQIDWDAVADQGGDTPPDQAWDALIASADQGFGGMSLDEAKSRGLIDDIQTQEDKAEPA